MVPHSTAPPNFSQSVPSYDPRRPDRQVQGMCLTSEAVGCEELTIPINVVRVFLGMALFDFLKVLFVTISWLANQAAQLCRPAND
jgi:hypothetical protein